MRTEAKCQGKGWWYLKGNHLRIKEHLNSQKKKNLPEYCYGAFALGLPLVFAAVLSTHTSN